MVVMGNRCPWFGYVDGGDTIYRRRLSASAVLAVDARCRRKKEEVIFYDII